MKKKSIMKKKKTLVYMVFASVFAYLFAQVVYFNQAYSPLQVLADARSEAKRLLRFITLYHFQCNATLQMANNSYWPLCTEKDGGINLESKQRKLAYSIGPRGDFEFEKLLSRNLSFHVYMFGTDLNPTEYLHHSNNTRNLKMSIVPNDPADFVRNSYDSQTINNVMGTLGHSQLDILKLDWFEDSSHGHEILYFLVKDKLLSKVNQLHIALHIDKVDDDYLYNWYRALYKLFHEARFRLYHTHANDQLCLQVTLMESCVYYMSWVHDPGPRSFVLYPPAKDGSKENEISRLVDYLSEEETTCPESMDIHLNLNNALTVCRYEGYLHKPCNIIIVRNKPSDITMSGLSHDKCRAAVLHITGKSQFSTVLESFVDVKGLLLQPSARFRSLMEALDHHLHSRSSNVLYLDIPDMLWDILTPLLDSGHLQSVHQLTIDVNLWNDSRSRLPYVVRRRYSELKRIAAYGFEIYKSKNLHDSTLHFQNNIKEQLECCHRLTYVRTRHVSIT